MAERVISIRDALEIQKAHDMLVSQLLGETPQLFNERGMEDLHVAAGVLCWVLKHAHNETFGNNLELIERSLESLGYVIADTGALFTRKERDSHERN